jgi:hypothetical protein
MPPVPAPSWRRPWTRPNLGRDHTPLQMGRGEVTRTITPVVMSHRVCTRRWLGTRSAERTCLWYDTPQLAGTNRIPSNPHTQSHYARGRARHRGKGERERREARLRADANAGKRKEIKKWEGVPPVKRLWTRPHSHSKRPIHALPLA